MALNIDHRLHYRCVFRLVPAPDASLSWGDVAYAIRRWLSGRIESNQAFSGKWFFVGGVWRLAASPRLFIQTERCIGDGNETTPQYWALRFEKPDDDVGARQWRTDIGLTVLGNSNVLFSLSTVNWLLPGFIGKEPDAPVPTAPGIISMLLRSREFRAFAGTEPLVLGPRTVREGAANEFVGRLMDAGRTVPIVLASKQYSTGKPLVDSARLARLLAGTATVYESETLVVDRELEYLLDPEYRCWNGRVRVYQPGINPNRPGDSRRHRYFTADDIKTLGQGAVEEYLVRGIVRRSHLAATEGVTSLEDVAIHQREERLTQLRNSIPSNTEWIAVLEEENAALTTQVREKEGDVSELMEMLTAETERAEAAEHEQRGLQYRNQALSDETGAAKKRAESLEQEASVLRSLSEFPSSVLDVVELIEKAYPTKLVFTDKARQSAEAASLKDASVAWRCLRDMATVLYDMQIKEKLPLLAIAKQFRDETGFELATNESESTKNDKKLMALRKLRYKGQDLETTVHVKYGRDPGKLLRVYYTIPKGEKVLVIGHCGDHLETSTTN